MWDLQSGKLLRSITDAHPVGSAVLHVMVRKERGVCSLELQQLFGQQYLKLFVVAGLQ